MDAAAALADLTEISAQIEAAVLLDGKGKVVASTLADEERAARVGDAGAQLLDAAAEGREAPPVRLEAATREGSVFVLREGGRTIVATTAAGPTSGLVLYDLKTCLGSIEEPKPKRTRKKKEPAADAEA